MECTALHARDTNTTDLVPGRLTVERQVADADSFVASLILDDALRPDDHGLRKRWELDTVQGAHGPLSVK